MKVTRQEAIKMLVEQQVNLFNEGQLSIDDILWYGWEAYEKRSNLKLMNEYNEGLEPDEMIIITDPEPLPDKIDSSWCIDDVRNVDEQREDDSIPELTDDECREVLRRVDDGHDATIGINWDVIEMYVNEVREERVSK